jgi:hypothetical protein
MRIARLLDAPAFRLEAAEVRQEAIGMLEDWRGLLRSKTTVSRQLLAKLLSSGRFTFHPNEQAGGRWSELATRPNVRTFLEAVPSVKKVGIPVRGFEPRSRG